MLRVFQSQKSWYASINTKEVEISWDLIVFHICFENALCYEPSPIMSGGEEHRDVEVEFDSQTKGAVV